AERGHFFAVQADRYLNQNAGSVTLQGVGPHRAPVIEILQDFEPLTDDLVTLPALDVRDKADTTGIMFIDRVVQTLLLGEIHHAHPQHKTTTGRRRGGMGSENESKYQASF